MTKRTSRTASSKKTTIPSRRRQGSSFDTTKTSATATTGHQEAPGKVEGRRESHPNVPPFSTSPLEHRGTQRLDRSLEADLRRPSEVLGEGGATSLNYNVLQDNENEVKDTMEEVVPPAAVIVDYLKKSQTASGFWKPHDFLKKAFKLSKTQLMLGDEKKQKVLYVWTTVLVLTYYMTYLLEYFHDWQKDVEQARSWLFEQDMFKRNQTDLVTSACSMLRANREYLFTTIFSKTESIDDLARAREEALKKQRQDEEDAGLGDWIVCYMETPPYTEYFYNPKTLESRWERPNLKIERLLREQAEQQKMQRMERSRNFKLPHFREFQKIPKQFCSQCQQEYLKPERKRERETIECLATIFCVKCDDYFCEECCDNIHINKTHAAHAEGSFRFQECYGIYGFSIDKKKEMDLDVSILGNKIIKPPSFVEFLKTDAFEKE